MVFIVTHHFLVHGLDKAGYYGNPPDAASLALNSFVIVGVNVFVLISGYFGINAGWKSFLRLYLFLCFYAVLFFVLGWITTGEFNFFHLITRFFPFSHSAYWFISAYFLLFLISPFLNFLAEKLDRSGFLKLLLVLLFVDIWFSYIWAASTNFGQRGYGLFHFIVLYFLAQFIARHTKTPDKINWRFLFGYLGFSMLIACFAIVLWKTGMADAVGVTNYAFAYSSPLVIGASMALLLFFRSLHFRSKVVNALAASVLAAYLIQESSFLSPILYGWFRSFGTDMNGNVWERLFRDFLILLISILFVFVAMLLDKVRVLLSSPLEKWATQFDPIKAITKRFKA
jgi:hypothetical protein